LLGAMKWGLRMNAQEKARAEATAARWRGRRPVHAVLSAPRRFLTNWLSLRILKLAHRRIAPVRLLVGCIVGLLWLGLGSYSALDAARTYDPETQPSASAPAPAPATGWRGAVARAAHGVCYLKNGKKCDFDDHDTSVALSQSALSALALLTLAFGFWTQLLGSFAQGFRAIGAGHVVITGEGGDAETLARDVARRGRPRRKAVALVRRNASDAETGALAADGVALIAGAPTDPGILRAAGVAVADRVIAMSAADTENLGVAACVRKLRRRTAPGDVLVRLESPDLRHDLSNRGRLKAADLFSLPEVAARLATDAGLLDEAVARGQNRVHLAVVGWSEYSILMAVRALRMMWAIGFEAPRITVFAPDSARRRAEFLTRYPGADAEPAWRADISFCDYDWRAAPDPWAPLRDAQSERGPITAVLVSWSDDQDTLRCAAVLAGHGGTGDPCLIVRESREETLVMALTRDGGPRVLAFAAPTDVISAAALVDRTHDEAARLVHQDYLTTCVIGQNPDAYAGALRAGRTLGQRLALRIRPTPDGDIAVLEAGFAARFGDRGLRRLRTRLAERLLEAGAFTPDPERPAQRPWDELDETYIGGNRHGADHAAIKLWSLGWRPARADEIGREPAIDPADITRAACEIEHLRWCADLLLNNWRFAIKRNDAQRLHPDLRPYGAFPAGEIEAAIDKDRGPWLNAPWVGSVMFPRRFVARAPSSGPAS
jgi:hypothetical protein